MEILARDVGRGQEAFDNIHKVLGPKRMHSKFYFHQLDITDRESCEKLATHLKAEHDGLDVLINNAGFAYKVSEMVTSKICFSTVSKQMVVEKWTVSNLRFLTL